MAWRMGHTFAEKFEQALGDKRRETPGYGLRTLARDMADGDKARIETIRRRLHKYRPPKGGGTAAIKPTEPTRREIEHAMGLPVDALAPDLDADQPLAAEQEFLLALRPVARLLAERTYDKALA